METGQQQSNPSPATNGSTKLETQCRIAGTPQRGEFRTCTSRIHLRHWPLSQPRHCRQWRIQGDRHDRNNSPKSTFDVRSAIQILPLTKHPPTAPSCTTWVKNMEDSNCFQKALDICALWTVHPAWSVALPDRVFATAAASARVITTPRPSCCRFLSGQTTARTSQCSARWRARRSATSLGLTACAPGDPLDDSPLPNCPLGTSPSRNGTSRASSFAGPLRWHSRDAWSLNTPRYRQILQEAMSRHQSWALLCRYHCRLLLDEIPNGTNRNSELKLRVRLGEKGQISDCKVLGQQNFGPLRRTARRVQPQTDEQRGKRACGLTAPRSISKAVQGLVGGSAHGSADSRRIWTESLVPRISALELIPPVRSKARRRELRGAVEGAKWHGARRGSKAGREQVSLRCRTSYCRLRVLLVPLANGRNTWMPSSLSQELARGDACFGSSTFSQSSGRQEACRKIAASCSTHN